MSNLAELVVDATVAPLPVPVSVTVSFASRVTVLELAFDGRTTEPNCMFWVLVIVVADITVTLAGAVVLTLPEAKAAVATAQSVSAIAAVRRPEPMVIFEPPRLAARPLSLTRRPLTSAASRGALGLPMAQRGR